MRPNIKSCLFDQAPWAILLLLFVLYLNAQHGLVFFYHDDFGLSVLDYVGSVSGFTGTEYTQAQLFEFLYGMYMNWSGRIAAFYLQINLSKYGVEFVRIFQVFVIVLVFWSALLVATRRGLFQPLIIVPLLYYISLPVFSVAGGLYWFSASSGYLWGVPFFFYAIYFILTRGIIDFTSSSLLAFSSGFHELLGIAVIIFLLLYLIIFWERQFRRYSLTLNFITVCFVLLPALAFFLAPGNFARKFATKYPADTVIGIFSLNLSRLNEIMVKDSESVLINYIFICSIVALLIKCTEVFGKRVIFAICFAVVLLTLNYVFLEQYFVVSFLLIYGVTLFLSSFDSDIGRINFITYCSTLGVLFALTQSPGIPGRAILLVYLLLLPVVLFSFVNVNSRNLRIGLILVIVMLVPSGIKNALYIYNGYKLNFQSNTLNHLTLSDAKAKYLVVGFSEGIIDLQKLPNSRFAEKMPYERKLIEKWIKKYYSLPAQVEFEWN